MDPHLLLYSRVFWSSLYTFLYLFFSQVEIPLRINDKFMLSLFFELNYLYPSHLSACCQPKPTRAVQLWHSLRHLTVRVTYFKGVANLKIFPSPFLLVDLFHSLRLPFGEFFLANDLLDFLTHRSLVVDGHFIFDVFPGRLQKNVTVLAYDAIIRQNKGLRFCGLWATKKSCLEFEYYFLWSVRYTLSIALN